MLNDKSENGPPRRAFLLPEEQPVVRVRTCRCCGFSGPETLFKSAGRGKHANTCKSCDGKRLREREASLTPEQKREKSRERYWRDVEKARARGREKAHSERGREINRKAVAKYTAAHPDRVAARTIARLAEKRGDIKRPDKCEVVGCNCSSGLHRHHPTYDKPREVVFVCRKHHEEIHHRRALPLRPGAVRKIARAPKPARDCEASSLAS